MNSLLTAAAALTTTVLLASGCASTTATDPGTAPAPRGEIVYRTGSNIPVKDTPATSKEEQDRRTAESQRALQQIQTPAAGNPRTN